MKAYSTEPRWGVARRVLETMDAEYAADGESCPRCGKPLGATDAVCFTCKRILFARLYLMVGAVEAHALAEAVRDADLTIYVCMGCEFESLDEAEAYEHKSSGGAATHMIVHLDPREYGLLQ